MTIGEAFTGSERNATIVPPNCLSVRWQNRQAFTRLRVLGPQAQIFGACRFRAWRTARSPAAAKREVPGGLGRGETSAGTACPVWRVSARVIGRSIPAGQPRGSRHQRKVAATGGGAVEGEGLRTPASAISMGDQAIREVCAARLELPQGGPGGIAILDHEFDRSKKLADHRCDHRSLVPVGTCEHPYQLYQHRNADISG